MTIAYTQGAKRRIKRGKGGRPKKPGPRVASSGRLSRAADDLDVWDKVQEALDG